MRAPIRSVLVVVLVLGFGIIPQLASASPGPPPDTFRPVWQQGREVTAGISPATHEPVAGTAEVYLIAPLDPEDPQDRGGVYPLPGGGTIAIPDHENVMPAWLGDFDRRAACFGYWTVAGPAGVEDHNVRTRLDPGGYGSDLELAYAIKVGGKWRELTSTHWIQVGLNHGVLDRQTLGPGGTCWIEQR